MLSDPIRSISSGHHGDGDPALPGDGLALAYQDLEERVLAHAADAVGAEEDVEPGDVVGARPRLAEGEGEVVHLVGGNHEGQARTFSEKARS